jgi:hypothetical protein
MIRQLRFVVRAILSTTSDITCWSMYVLRKPEGH